MFNKLITLLAVLLVSTCAQALTVNLLIQRNASNVHMDFADNYAVLINQDHFYGPISKTNDLLLEAAAGGKIRISVRYKQNKKELWKNLGTTAGRVEVVRGLAGVNFTSPKPVLALKGQSISAKNASALKIASPLPFFTLNRPEYGGKISYSGAAVVLVNKGRLSVVETVDMERYLEQVVNCELNGVESLETLKAQAVLARTFALFMIRDRLNSGRAAWSDFQLLSTPSDQAYNCKARVRSNGKVPDVIKEAVSQTKGIVVTRNGKLLLTQYNSCSSGKKMYRKDFACQNEMHSMGKKGLGYRKILGKFFSKVSFVPLMQTAAQADIARIQQVLKQELASTM